MLDCPVCPRTQIAGESCPQCGADLKPLLRLSQLRSESQKPPVIERRGPPAFAAATFLVGLAIVPAWQQLHPGPHVIVNPPEKVKPVEEQPKPKEAFYTVARGDSFWSIAKQKYGIGEMWKMIRDDNKDRLRRPGRLRKGDVIRLRSVTISPK
jgi:nucleoid-associated protein YgaU